MRDVRLPCGDNSIQFDHVIVSVFGIYVIETRHLSGWILGSERQANWIQVFPHRKIRFRNPLLKVQRCVRAFSDILELDLSKFHPMLVFTGSTRFSMGMPGNVIKFGGLLPYVQFSSRELLDYDEVERLVEHIEYLRLEPEDNPDMAAAENLKIHHSGFWALLGDIRGLVRNMPLTMHTAKIAVAVVFLGASLLISNNMLNPESGIAIVEAGEVPVEQVFAQASEPRPEMPLQQPARSVVAEPLQSAGTQPLPDVVFTHSREYLSRMKASQLERQQQQESERQLAWESSLMCAISDETRRCFCFEPRGVRAELDSEQCRLLVSKGSALSN
jgi:hypothetical protein